MGRILVGISAWSDRSLVESGFYPAGVKTPADRLRYYGQEFPVAEIDSSYHFFPTRRNLELWLENTPEAIRAAGKLGAVLFQFPPWFHPSPENLDYIGQCRDRLASYRLAVEFRVGAWLDDGHREDTLRFLREHGLTLACVDEPQGFRSSVLPVAGVTAPLAFIRFHGRNGANWEKKGIPADERYSYLYDEKELEEWVPKIAQMAEKSAELHIIFKNKHGDYPARNARQLRLLLGL